MNKVTVNEKGGKDDGYPFGSMWQLKENAEFVDHVPDAIPEVLILTKVLPDKASLISLTGKSNWGNGIIVGNYIGGGYSTDSLTKNQMMDLIGDVRNITDFKRIHSVTIESEDK